jgi:hypothetical protein
LPERPVISQRSPDAQSEVTRIRVHEPRRDSSIPAMTVNQSQISFAHLPTLLNENNQDAVEHDFSRMVTMKVNVHLQPPSSPKERGTAHREQNTFTTPGRFLQVWRLRTVLEHSAPPPDQPPNLTNGFHSVEAGADPQSTFQLKIPRVSRL